MRVEVFFYKLLISAMMIWESSLIVFGN